MNYTICKKCFAALLAAGAIVSSMPFVSAVNETSDKMNEQGKVTALAVHSVSDAEKTVNEDGSVTLAFGKDVAEKVANEDGSITLTFGKSKEKTKKITQLAFHGMPRARYYPFDAMWISSSELVDMNFTMEDIRFQNYSKFEIDGKCSEPYTTLYFKLYRYVNGDPKLISTANRQTDSHGDFYWSSAYGVDGNYGIKVWGDITCTISGDLMY